MTIENSNPSPPKIRFNDGQSIGQPATATAESGPSKPSTTTVTGTSKIRTFGKAVRHDENWSRKPNITGNGATHVRTFHAKLTDESLRYMDQQINEWLDKHTEYEVKFVTNTIGAFSGKVKEPALLIQVWV